MKNLHWWLLILCIPLYGFWNVPALNDTRPKLQKALNVELAKIETAKTNLANLNAQKKDLELAGAQEAITDTIPLVLEQEFLILDLRRITQSAGFTTPGFTFSKGQNQATGAVEMKVAMSVKGSRENLVKLLKLIETNERFLGLESLNFATEPNGNTTNATFNIYALAQSF